ncbi:unnamed protein product [Owenia fusiformis]|uniref:Uncharacterized protein n=1 Tax=Owenia fusiformis TaxID=6347 RepID=A0A8S4NQW4_OWEFU|nr:unnamed protein product [Owenia fusiformis]
MCNSFMRSRHAINVNIIFVLCPSFINMAEAKAKGPSFRWESLKGMPTKRVFSSPVECNGCLYVVGGCDAKGVPLPCFEMYDPGKRHWSRLADMPTKRAGAAAAVVGDNIIVFGGVAETQQPLDCVEAYNIKEKKWTVKEPMIEHLLGISAVVKDGQVLVLGGMALDTNPRDFLLSYNIETNKWKSMPSMPTARYATFSFLLNDEKDLYVIGGRQGKLPTTAFEVFNFETNKWRELPAIPSKRVFALYTTSDTHMFSMGGLKKKAQEGFSDVCEAFDLKNEEWKVGKSIPTARGDFAIAYMGNKVICAGGLGNQGKPLTTVEAYDLDTDSWSEIGYTSWEDYVYKALVVTWRHLDLNKCKLILSS